MELSHGEGFYPGRPTDSGKKWLYQNKKTMEGSKRILSSNKIPYKEMHSVEGDILAKIMNLVYVLDYASIYRIIMSKIDPT